MRHARLADDTPPAIETLQVEAWRRVTPTDKAALVTSFTRAAFSLALAGVRQRYPDATPREHFLRLAIINLGRDLAIRAYPEIESLDLR